MFSAEFRNGNPHLRSNHESGDHTLESGAVYAGSWVKLLTEARLAAAGVAGSKCQLEVNAVIGLLQRVSRAEVTVEGRRIAAIGTGLLVLVGVERDDDESRAKRLAERLVQYRVFSDDAGRMNRCVRDVGGAVLLVPQFTLAADTQQGNRPGFSRAADPERGKRLFDVLVSEVRSMSIETEAGRFGASMQVSLTNEGPVTFWLRVPPRE